jgi:type II secretion system protein N
VLPLIFGIVDVSFGLEGLGGTLDGSFRRGKQDARARLRTRDLALGQIPGLADKLGLPLAGRLDLEVELELPQQKFAEARGSIDLSCSECSVGDGKAKLKIPSDPFLAQGVTVPRVRLGTLRGQVTVEKGAASLHKVEAKSADAELSLDGRIDLADPVTRSQLQLYLRFRPSAAMIQREATFQLLTSSLESGKRSDGFFGLAVGGTLAAPQVRPSKQDMTSKFPSRGAPYRGEGRRPGGRELGRGLGGGLGRPDTLGPRGLRDFDLRPSGGEPRGGELRGSEARPEGLPEAQPMLPQPSPPPPPLPPPPPPPSPTPSSPPAAAPPAAAPSPPPGVPPGIMRIVPVDPRPADAGAPAASEAPAPETPAPPAPEPAPAPPED